MDASEVRTSGLYAHKTPPFAHQRAALVHLRAWERSYFAWFMEMGTGKSKVLLDNAGALHERGEIDGLFIVAPKTVCLNWFRRELPAHLPDRIARRVVLWRPETARRKRKALEDELRELMRADGLAVLVMNPEALLGRGLKVAEEFVKRRRVLLAVDESDAILRSFRSARSRTGKRAMALVKLARSAPYRRILTGTAVTVSPLDLWGQCEFLEPGALGDRSVWSFRTRYCELERVFLGSRSVETPTGRYQNLEQLAQIVAGFSYCVKKAECLDLPAKLYTTRYVEPTPEQLAAYSSMRDELYAVLQTDRRVEASIALTALLRCQQILCGYAPDAAGDVVELPSNRLAALAEVLEALEGKQAVIWSPFRADVERIAGMLNSSARVLHGDVSSADRDRAVDDFQSGAARYIVGTTATGGAGITLTAASAVVYYANSWKPRDRLQSEDRAHRIGLTHPVTYVDLVCPGTLDESILNALRAGRDLAAELIRSTGEQVRAWL